MTQENQGAKSGTGKFRTVANGISLLFRNSVCAWIWGWVASRAMLLDYPLTPALLDGSDKRLATAVGVGIIGAASVLVANRPWRVRFWLWELLRLLFFPVFLLFYALYLPFLTIKSTEWMNRCGELVLGRNPVRSLIHLLALLSISIVLSVSFSDTAIHWCALVTAYLSVIAAIRLAFQWASQPLAFSAATFSMVRGLARLASKTNRDEVAKATGREKIGAQQKLAKNVKTWLPAAVWTRNKIDRNADLAVMAKQFMAVFVIVLSIVVLAFGIAHYSLNMLGYAGGASHTTLLQQVFYSLLVITTSADLGFGSGLWECTVVAEIASGLGLLTLLILFFSTATPKLAAQGRQELLAEVDRWIDDLNRMGKDGTA